MVFTDMRIRWGMMLVGLWALMGSAQTVQESTAVAVDSVIMAEDFRFVTNRGDTLRLRQLPNDRLTLLVLYDPDCSDCRQLLFALRHSSAVNQRVGEQLLQVLTVDVGQNPRLTRRVQRDLPVTWLKGTLLSNLSQSRLYDTSAVPMLYLLDADQRVMLADNEMQSLISLLNSLW